MHRKNMSENVRKTYVLNGEWDMSCGEHIPSSYEYRIPVPGLVDLAEPGFEWQGEEYFWYRKKFVIKPERKKYHAFLRIDQSQFGTEAYLNGNKLGSYNGCYTSHEYCLDKYIRHKGENEIAVRVGAKKTLSPDSAVGIDWERISYIPGIWGDVSLYTTGDVRIKNIQVIPVIRKKAACVLARIENLSGKPVSGKIRLVIRESRSMKQAGKASIRYSLGENGEETWKAEAVLRRMKLWSPDSPSLYTAEVTVSGNGASQDCKTVTFGMREFKIKGKNFYLNGKKIVLKGSNIAFHRFLSDPERKDLVWNTEWIKKALVDVPKAHNFNFFRNHLGQMYGKWYDIADKYGIMLQDEWAFWSYPTGSGQQIKNEFSRWMEDNWNHPSIIIWDCLNEPEYHKKERAELIKYVKYDMVAELRENDPTRPWEPTDFEEIHPYIYSWFSALGKNDGGPFDFIGQIKKLKTPAALNEYIYFWVDQKGDPSELTRGVARRWLGNDATVSDRLGFQAFLAGELTELFRRMKVAQIAPFVYLSANSGATSHWFKGNISRLDPKPVMNALKNAFEDFGVSVDLWDRHFFPGESRQTSVYVFNDKNMLQKGRLDCFIADGNGRRVQDICEKKVSVPPAAVKIARISWDAPLKKGRYYIEARLYKEGENPTDYAFSRKKVNVYEEIRRGKDKWNKNIVLFDPAGEIRAYLRHNGIRTKVPNAGNLEKADIIAVAEGGLSDPGYKGYMDAVESAVKKGKTLIVCEPEYNADGAAGLEITGEKVTDLSRSRWGGESCVFPENPQDPLWKGIAREDLVFFNGGWGGEIISDHILNLPQPFIIGARCGLDLSVPAVLFMHAGHGLIVISRIQTRGRLLEGENTQNGRSGRRPDPVAHRYMKNLIKSYCPGSAAAKKLLAALKKMSPVIKKATASSVDYIHYPFNTLDPDPSTKWNSGLTGRQWIYYDMGEARGISGIEILWGKEHAEEYVIEVSSDSVKWKTVVHIHGSSGGKDTVKFVNMIKTRYVKINCIKSSSEAGYE
ncbi:MAG: discoidin domain-containing protein, partial [Elusimicrobia bacterium]|nr:discoidin domain-containing protein [Elusimicrobiota bacterium]